MLKGTPMLTLDHPEYGRIVISKPEPTADGKDHTCSVTCNGVGGSITGVTPLDALENAVKTARAFAPIRDDDPNGWQVS